MDNMVTIGNVDDEQNVERTGEAVGVNGRRQVVAPQREARASWWSGVAVEWR